MEHWWSHHSRLICKKKILLYRQMYLLFSNDQFVCFYCCRLCSSIGESWEKVDRLPTNVLNVLKRSTPERKPCNSIITIILIMAGTCTIFHLSYLHKSVYSNHKGWHEMWTSGPFHQVPQFRNDAVARFTWANLILHLLFERYLILPENS